MKHLKDIITERLKLTGKTESNYYTCQPKNRKELIQIIETRLNKDPNADLNDIDVSKITDMIGLFHYLDPHDIKIDQWDVSNVTNMNYMFADCQNFNCDLSEWDISNVEYMSYMFIGCEKFNCDLNKWKTSKVKNMTNAFYLCNALKNKPTWYKK